MRQITLRIISSILLIAIMLSTLSSCFIFGKGDEPDGGGTGETPGGDTTGGEDPASGLFWGVGADTYLVIGEGIVTVPDTLSSAIFETTGKVPVYKAAGSEATEHEIIIGEADRNVSRAAYRLLEEKSELGYSGYVICSSGTSVAIAFTEWESLELAVEAFLDGFYKVSDGKIILESAVLAEKAFNLFEYYGELDEQIMEERWATLEKYVDGTGYNGKATVDAFKKLYSLYSDDAYFWLANLWDPVTGGFYYSNPGFSLLSLPQAHTYQGAYRIPTQYPSLCSRLPRAHPV